MVDAIQHEVQVRKQFRILKVDDTAHVIFGEVLVPETVDLQNEIYSAEVIKATAYKFLEQFANVGFMHEFLINDKAKIVESYLAPVDFEITVASGEVRKIIAGTWLMSIRIVSLELWKLVVDGVLNAFSIGGRARATEEQMEASTGSGPGRGPLKPSGPGPDPECDLQDGSGGIV